MKKVLYPLLFAAILFCSFSPAFAGLIGYWASSQDASGNWQNAIMTIPESGGQPNIVISSTPALPFGENAYPTWSPLGTEILFKGSGITKALYTVTAPIGSTPINVTSATGIDYVRDDGFGWSPDGLTITFNGSHYAADRSYLWDIFTAPSTGGPGQQLTADGLNEWAAPVYSPDGKTIAVTGMNSTKTSFNLFIIPSTGGTQTLLDDNVRRGRVSWSPDSKRIVYVKYDPVNAQQNDVYVVDLTSGVKTNLTNGLFLSKSCISPTFSPDGTKIAFILAGYPSTVYVMPASGGAPQALVSDAFLSGGSLIGWSPDSTKIAYPYVQGPYPPYGIATVTLQGQIQYLTPPVYMVLNSVSFQPAPTISSIISLVNSSAISGQPIASSLTSTLDNAFSLYNQGNVTAATNTLNALINKIQAQSGKTIDPAVANDLINNVNNVIANL